MIVLSAGRRVLSDTRRPNPYLAGFQPNFDEATERSHPTATLPIREAVATSPTISDLLVPR